jgi:hypothetical protein
MKSIRSFFILLCCIVIFGCGTKNQTIISESANLSKYNYATISNVMNYTGSPNLMDITVRLYDELSKTRLTMIGEKEIISMNDNQKNELLLIKYSATQTTDESVVSINFYDFITARPLASFRGAYAFGMTEEQDMEVAIKNAIQQVRQYF